MTLPIIAPVVAGVAASPMAAALEVCVGFKGVRLLRLVCVVGRMSRRLKRLFSRKEWEEVTPHLCGCIDGPQSQG